MKSLIVFILLIILSGCYTRFRAIHLGYGEKCRITAEGAMVLYVAGEGYEVEVLDNRNNLEYEIEVIE